MKKWSRRGKADLNLGAGFESGEYVIEETWNEAYDAQKKYGGSLKNYMWKLRKGNEVLRYGKSAKELKEFAETL